MNRVALTIRLMESVKACLSGFQGEILFVDNGSSPDQLAALHNYCNQMPYATQIIEVGENIGVARARNLGVKESSHEWVMSLDNDIYFVSNPLETIQDEIQVLGLHFMSLPLLNEDGKTVFASGGNIFIDLNTHRPAIGGGSTGKHNWPVPSNAGASLSTFLYGGSSVFRKDTFLDVGGFDEGFFIGFEDVDFSVELFQRGLKVGASGTFALIHAHPAPTDDADKDYARLRFSREMIMKSALHFESKRGFQVATQDLDEWISKRRRDLALDAVSSDEVSSYPPSEARAQDPVPSVASPKLGRKPKIALVVDTPDWAFANIAAEIETHLSEKFEFLTVPVNELDDVSQLWLLVSDCDLVHVFWGNYILQTQALEPEFFMKKYGISKEAFMQKYVFSRRISLGIYDHLHLDESNIRLRRDLYSDIACGYSVSSEKLRGIYEKIPSYPSPKAVIQDGVDLSLFTPNPTKFADLSSRTVRIGWVGNSKWAAHLGDPKGLRTILLPALDLLKARNLDIDFVLADRSQKFIPKSQMPNFYQGIDVLVCSSLVEGTPNPVLEAMASSCAIVSTDVGIVPEALGTLQREFILDDRTPENLAEKLAILISEPQRIIDLASENTERIASWNWDTQAAKFQAYFESLLARASVIPRLALEATGPRQQLLQE